MPNKKINTPQNICKTIEAFLDARKAQDIVCIDVHGKSTLSDYMIIASGTSQRHIKMMGELLKQELHKLEICPVFIEGAPDCDWILLDAGDVIIHLFRPEVRTFYNLEKMWGVDLAEFSRQATSKP